MTFCNFQENIDRIKALMEANNWKEPEKLNEYLKACVYLEAASFVGFWNVIQGYYMARSVKDAMCKMCKEADDSVDLTKAGAAEAHLNKVRMEPYEARDKITKQEKAELCFWLQYINNLANPSAASTKASEAAKTNPLACLMPNMGCWPPRPC